MKIRDNVIFHKAPQRGFRRFGAKLALAACVAIAAVTATGTAPASASTSVPYHRYDGSCTGLYYLPGDSHPYDLIKISPKQIDSQPGVATQYLNSPTYNQFIYFRLWVWNRTATGTWKWQGSAAKRVLNGFPMSNPVEAWDNLVGKWMPASLSDFYNPVVYDPNNPSNNMDMLLFGNELGVYVRADLNIETWYLTAETYWAPAFTGSGPADTDSTIPSGGLDTYDLTSTGSWPTVTCP